MDVMCWNLMRQIAGGDISNRNLWLAENMLELYVENRTWLDKLPILIASVIFTFLRILEDHFVPQLASLRQKEVLRLDWVYIVCQKFEQKYPNPNKHVFCFTGQFYSKRYQRSLQYMCNES